MTASPVLANFGLKTKIVIFIIDGMIGQKKTISRYCSTHFFKGQEGRGRWVQRLQSYKQGCE
jgi:hypothetical protein